MTKILIEVINMSISASITALFVMLVRMPLKKAPKVFSYALWLIVFFQLICPFRLESPVSFLPNNADLIPQTVGNPFAFQPDNPPPAASNPAEAVVENTAIDTETNQESSITVESGTYNASNPISVQHLILLSTILWLSGFAFLTIYAAVGYILMKRKVYDATLVSKNIFESDKIPTAFVLGWIRPKIYLPSAVQGSQREFIIKHEMVHIKRRDYLIKPLAFLIVAIHWFNPVVWISYYLLSADIELSCDEAVLRSANQDIRKVYCYSLVNLYTRNPGLLSPLAFGEGSFNDMKVRMKNVLQFKKTPRWAMVLCVTFLLFFAVGFNTKPPQDVMTIVSAQAPAAGQYEPVNENVILNAQSMDKDIVVNIDRVVKNEHALWIEYSVEDKQNRFNGEHLVSIYTVDDGYTRYSGAIKNEDGKYYGAIHEYFKDGFKNEAVTLSIEQMQFNQVAGNPNMKLDLKLSDLKTPSVIKDFGSLDEWGVYLKDYHANNPSDAATFVEDYQKHLFLQPDEYNIPLPIAEGQGEAWLSNIGVIGNELHIQLKTLNRDTNDGVIVSDLQTRVVDKNGNSLEEKDTFIGEFSMDDNGKTYFIGSNDNGKYHLSERVFILGDNNVQDLNINFGSYSHGYLRGSWAPTVKPELSVGAINLDLTGIKTPNRDASGVITGYAGDQIFLESMTVTPLYYSLTFQPEDELNWNLYSPTVVITYNDGRKLELIGHQNSFRLSEQKFQTVRFTGDDRTGVLTPIEVDNIQSITIDGIEVFQ